MNVIVHNLMAMNTAGQYNISNHLKAKSSEKLSSGYKINRSADDAAGLSISEKMRSQIRGLNRASDNIQDGISLSQVADGALNETHSIPQRMNELAVQSANGTNSDSDRQALQAEVEELMSEMDRIAETTCFNDTVYPLKGMSVTAVKGAQGFPISSIDIEEETWYMKNAFADGQSRAHNGQVWAYGDTIEVTGLKIKTDGADQHALDVMFNFQQDWIPGHTVDASWEGWSGNYDLKLSDLKVDNDGYIYYESKELHRKMYFFKAVSGGKFEGIGVMDSIDLTKYEYMVADPTVETRGSQVWLQTGADTMNGMAVRTVDASVSGCGLDGVSIATEKGADLAMDKIGDAITRVSSYRTLFGATQNRLESAMRIVDNTSENTQSAESVIRDTDMADEMVKFSKENILSQVGQSMLAQANQSTQGVLSLLQM